MLNIIPWLFSSSLLKKRARSSRPQPSQRRGRLQIEELESRQMMSVTGFAPAMPSFTAQAVSGSQVNLYWNSASGATGYVVDEWTSNGWTQIATPGSGSTSLAVTGLNSGTTYYFDVASTNATGMTWAANWQSVTTPTYTPAAPSFTLTPVSGTEIDIVWNNAAGATSYAIDEWTSGGWTQIATTGGTSLAVTGLKPGTTYYFDVASMNAYGTTWAVNWQSAMTPLDTPATPAFTLTPASGTEIDIAWNSTARATSYVIDEWTSSGWTQIGTTGGTSFAATGLTPGQTYYFDVAAVNASGTTWATTWQSADTLKGGGAPAFTLTPTSSTEIDIAWKTAGLATGYVVDEWINGSWVQIATPSAGSTGLAVTGLTPGTTYYFDVAAVSGGAMTWAVNWQSATTLAGSVTVDHPAADTSYTVATGSLFGTGGPSYLDVKQGAVGDCWLLASLAEVAARVPADITNMFTYDGTTVENGTTVSLYFVRLFDSSGTAHKILVDTELPSGGGYYDHTTGGILWVALAEKAYAQANGAGYVTSQHVGTDSYAAMDGGYPSWALQAITGLSASSFSINPSNIAAAWNAGQLIVLGSSSSASSQYIVGDSTGTHAYAVVGYDSSSSKPFEVYNPWGTDSSGWALGTHNGHQVYGLFNADAAFLSANFANQYIGSGSEADIGMKVAVNVHQAKDGVLAMTFQETSSSPEQPVSAATLNAFWTAAGNDATDDLLFA